ncbi:hypothetical protein [Streptomyces synnematoformans]|uniref:Uncharacterized protein n=1 Tax=Streptomyces synnematoformans TaxID=415721 RepID=A0ABN2X7X5_9ACTN
MGEIDELRRRMEALEAQVHELTEQQAATRHLAVNSDRDVAALQEQRRADIQLFQALRQTQLEQGKVLDSHSKVLDSHSKTLEEHGKLLNALVSGQVAIMEHLGMNPPEPAADGG